MSRPIDYREVLVVHAELRAASRRLCRELDQLRVEIKVLHEAGAPLTHQAPAREQFGIIYRLRNRFTAKRLCWILVTDRSTYSVWTRAREPRKVRAAEERELFELIVEVHATHPAHGTELITREFRRQGFGAGWRRVAGLVWENSISGG